jgi:hypothetical protein
VKKRKFHWPLKDKKWLLASRAKVRACATSSYEEVRTRRKPVLMRELNIFPAIHVISLWGKTSLLSILVKLLLNKISKTYLL